MISAKFFLSVTTLCLLIYSCASGAHDQSKQAGPSATPLGLESSPPQQKFTQKSTKTVADLVVHRSLGLAIDDQTVEVDDFAVDPTKVKIRVVDIYGLKNSGRQYRSYSVREVASSIRPVLLIDGGSSISLSVPVALGLVIDDGKLVSEFNAMQGFASGVFCVDSSERVSIIKKEKYKSGMCRNALQSGPLLIEPGAVLGERPTERATRAYSRSLVALDRRGGLHFLITSPAHLYDLAKVMLKPVSDGGLGCSVALNLGTGTAYSGLYASDGTRIGNLDAAVPAAIAVLEK